MSTNKYASIVVNRKAIALDKIFDYLIPESLSEKAKIGSVCRIPFGSGILEGVIVDLPEKPGVENLKEIIDIVSPRPLFSGQLLQLSRYIADYYITTWAVALQAMLPAGLELTGRLPKSFYVKKYSLKELHPESRMTVKQKAVYDYLVLHSSATEDELLKLDVSKDILKRMVKNDLLICQLERQELIQSEYQTSQVIFSKEQEAVYNRIKNEMDDRRKPFLLHGVTGSGKTEIYLRLIEKVVKEGRQAIFLVPEIALTSQMVDFLKKRLSIEIAVLHSGMTQTERRMAWQRIAEGTYPVVLGARSAVFAPLENLGLIIIDEEQETSYKQDNNPRFHAREVAKERCRISGAQLVLGSATPSVESYYRAKNGEYELAELRERYYTAPLPRIEIVDMREELRVGNRSLVSNRLQEELERCLLNGEQGILLLNRRGYHTFYSCRECGEVLYCPHCSIPLVFHEGDGRLKCHYCGYHEKVPQKCPVCHSKAIRHFGAGTERLVHELEHLLPSARIARLDQDITEKRGSYEKIYHSMLKGEIDILVGTQMIAKGLDFPKVTLAGVLAADLTLNLPDFRAGERTFQLLTQLTGRAGRREKQGLAIIQTYNPLSPVIQAVLNNDYQSFYQEQSAYYREKGYPPYKFLIRLVINSDNVKSLTRATKIISILLKEALGGEDNIYGPAQAPREKIKDRYRMQVLLKADNDKELVDAIRTAIEKARLNKMLDKDVTVQIDVDPYNMM